LLCLECKDSEEKGPREGPAAAAAAAAAPAAACDAAILARKTVECRWARAWTALGSAVPDAVCPQRAGSTAWPGE
jgi:hypothetical protein